MIFIINKLESKSIRVPKDRLIFVGDSLRGDIGSSLIAKNKNKKILGQGVLVLNNKKELIQIKKQISKDPKLKMVTDSMNIYGLVIEDVPLDEEKNPMLLSRFADKFLEKL